MWKPSKSDEDWARKSMEFWEKTAKSTKQDSIIWVLISHPLSYRVYPFKKELHLIKGNPLDETHLMNIQCFNAIGCVVMDGRPSRVN